MKAALSILSNLKSERGLLTILSGFTLFFVLFVYKGYGIQTGVSFSGHNLLSRALIFGLFTSATFYVNEFVILKRLRVKTLKAKIAFRAWEIFAGANVTFFLFNYFWQWTELYWKGYFLLLYEYTFVLIFPILISYIVSYRGENKFVPVNNLMVFDSENGKHKFSILPENLLFIRSADNYIELFYNDSQNNIKKELIRNSLKNIEESYSQSSYFMRCHRSYIINPMKIKEVSILNKNMYIHFGSDSKIPVSQKYQDNVKAYIKEVSPRI